MAEMSMIETPEFKIEWECSACGGNTKDCKGFEDKVKKCPKCGEPITAFHSLFDEDE